MLEIRLLTKSDSATFFEHRLEGLKLVPTAFGASYEDELARVPSHSESILSKEDKRNVIYGAFEDGTLIGCVGVFQESAKKSSHKAIIWGMYVKSAFQGQGIGKKLVEAAMAHIKKIPEIRAICLSCESSNKSAKALYESCGFKTWGHEPQAMLVDEKFYDEDHMVILL